MLALSLFYGLCASITAFAFWTILLSRDFQVVPQVDTDGRCIFLQHSSCQAFLSSSRGTSYPLENSHCKLNSSLKRCCSFNKLVFSNKLQFDTVFQWKFVRNSETAHGFVIDVLQRMNVAQLLQYLRLLRVHQFIKFLEKLERILCIRQTLINHCPGYFFAPVAHCLIKNTYAPLPLVLLF